MTPAADSQIQPLILLIDGDSLAFRSYFAFAKGRDGGLRTKSGIPTSVSYGFLKALLEVMEAEKPQYVAIAFDLSEKTFRHDSLAFRSYFAFAKGRDGGLRTKSGIPTSVSYGFLKALTTIFDV